MRPATAVSIEARERLAFTAGLHLLDFSRVGESYISWLVSRLGGEAIRPKYGGRTLPNEIWTMILKILKEDPTGGDFFLVRASPDLPAWATENIPGWQLVRCERYDFNLNEYKPLAAGWLETQDRVEAFEWFLRHPDRFSVPDIYPVPPTEHDPRRIFIRDWDTDSVVVSLPPLSKAPFTMPGSTVYVWLPSQPDALHIPSLYIDVSVPDIISCLDLGECRTCCGARELYPLENVRGFQYGGGVGGRHRRPQGIYEESEAVRFDVRVIENTFYPCPLCMGRDLIEEFNSMGGILDVEKMEAIQRKAKNRRKELCYE